ncbi:glycosyltransferase family 2 protein [Brachyspira catarrhinii]|uniref:Glycosyltransferase n=1 Tax=Brachyspira catarrhinii TaxID=2528966 RepID=A0ABY2TT58_9SPIR|nr:glycosyltransferase [Brachyspira catarrhinii]TKZ35788.1 glycosyltransferase [Brachyspira catarrhinii]
MTKFNPLISIIIPVYNGQNFIKDSINSALNQTYKNIEIIVVDDGSTDNTANIVKTFSNKVVYIYKDNGGVSSALNLGIKKSNGKYISWLSHDDLYINTKIEEQINELNKLEDKNTIIYSGYELIDENNNLISAIEISSKNEYRYLNNGLYAAIMYCLYGCTLLIPKDIFYKVSFFNEELKYCQDYELWLKIFKDKYKIRYIPKVLAQYRLHQQQDSSTRKTYMISEAEEIFINALSSFNKNDYKNIFYNKYNVLRIMKNIHKDFPNLIAYINKEQNILLEKNKKYINDHNKISIVIYIDNDLSNLENVVDSVLKQNYINIEILFITDNSCIINQIDILLKNIKYKIIPTNEKENIFNFIEGDFIQFLRSKDILLENKFNIQMEDFKNNPHINISYSKYYIVINNKKKYLNNNTYKLDNLKQFENIVFLWNEKIYIPLYTLLIKKEALRNVKIIYNNDYLIIVDLAYNNYFNFIDEYLACSLDDKVYKKELESIDIKNKLIDINFESSKYNKISNKIFYMYNNYSYLIIKLLKIKITIKRSNSIFYKVLLHFSNCINN